MTHNEKRDHGRNASSHYFSIVSLSSSADIAGYSVCGSAFGTDLSVERPPSGHRRNVDQMVMIYKPFTYSNSYLNVFSILTACAVLRYSYLETFYFLHESALWSRMTKSYGSGVS